MLTIREGLNLCCLALAMISKGPQIWHQFQRGSSQGIAFTSLFLETLRSCEPKPSFIISRSQSGICLISFSLSITFCYFAANDYPWSDFLEYPCLITQNLILFGLCAWFESKRLAWSLTVLSIYSTLLLALSQTWVPLVWMGCLSSLVIPLTSLSKLSQIRTIIQTRRGDLVSRLPWAVFGATSAARFYTVLVVSGDLLLLLQYSVSVILNTMVLLVAIAYTPQTSLKRD